MTKHILVYIFIFLQHLSLSGQCPGRDSIVRAIAAIKTVDTTELPGWLAVQQQLINCKSEDIHTRSKVARLIGNYYFYKDNYFASINYGKMSVDLLHRLLVLNKTALIELADSYRLLSYCYEQVSEPLLRIKAIDSVLAIERRADTTYKGTCLVGRYKVKWLFEKGDYRHCVNTGNIMLDYINKYYTGSNVVPLKLTIITYQIQAHMFLDETDKAWQLLLMHEQDFRKAEATGYVGVMHNLMTNLFQLEKNGPAAANNIRKAFQSYQGRYSKGCAQSMVALSEVYLDLFKKPDSSLHFARVGLKYADAVDSLSLLTVIARAYVSQKKVPQALTVIQQAFGFIGPGFDETALIGKPVDEYVTPQLSQSVVSLVTTKGDALRKRFEISGDKSDLESALRIYKCVNQILVDIKSSHLESDSKLSWQKTVHSLYENAIEASYVLNRPDAAFYFFENSRAFLLSEGMKYSQMMLDREKEMQAEYRLELQRLTGLSAALDRSDPVYEETTDAINRILIKQEELKRKLLVRRSMFSADPYSGSFEPPVHLNNTVLRHHNALVEIFEGDSAVYTWSFDRKLMKITKANRAEYDALIAQYMKGLSRQPTLTSEVLKWQRASAALYQLLFKGHQLPTGRLIISPDRNSVPFDCLITGYKHNKPEYLLQRAALSYTYSAGYLEDVRKPRATDRVIRFSGFAPVRFASSMRLNALTGSDKSLTRIDDVVDVSRNRVGPHATKAAFIKGLHETNIVHLYTHAALNPKTGEPEIYFHDSVLTLNEMVLAAEPTVRIINLAACETALGKSYYGEGVFSFSRVLASYGIPTAIANVWSVSDKATYKLNELFYKFLSQGMTADVALQHAKLVFLREASSEMSSPYYWAASILTGESEIAYPPYKWRYAFIALGACIGIIVLACLIMKLWAYFRHR